MVVVHPGMGGSALNWPEHHWAALTRMVAESGFFRVILSGGPGENALLDRISAGFSNILPVRKFLGKSLSEMMGILAVSSFVVAPSTGPLHVASALGVPVAGIYSPIREQSPERWGPYGAGTSRTFTPERFHENCMADIDPVEVYSFLENNLAGFPHLSRCFLPVSSADKNIAISILLKYYPKGCRFRQPFPAILRS